MAEDIKETCMKELGFQIFDQDEKVTVVQVSNAWEIPLTEATSRLETLAKRHEHEELHREFLVRGVSKKTNRTIITVIPEEKVAVYEDRLEVFSKSLWSLCKKRASYEELNYKRETPKVISLTVTTGTKERQVHVIPEARPAMEKEKKKSMFAMPASSSKKEKPTPETKKPTQETKKPVPEEKTPQKQSPEKKGSSPRKSAEKSTGKGGKTTPKVQLGKGSIATFFGQKGSGGSGNKKSEAEHSPDAMDVDSDKKEEEKKLKSPKKEPESPKEPAVAKKKPQVPAETETSRKRNLSSDPSDVDQKKGKKKSDESAEEPSTKKAKKEVKTKKVEKRSRIMKICDSDSSEDEGTSAKGKARVDSEKEEEGEEMSVEPEKTKPKKGSPDENRNPDTTKKRRKAMRKVTKSYQDEDGFIRTVRETEEYSCSDEEEVVVAKPVAKVEDKKSSPTTATLKPKVPSKQGSIMSFFNKK